MKKGFLILESGESFEGVWRGGPARAGEVVFNTSHSGYEEIATDPSYFKQIVVMTAPMQGNYGVDKEIWESKKLWIDGFISLEIAQNGWLERLSENSIPCMTAVDTRELVLRLRSGGTPWGALIPESSLQEAQKVARVLIEEQKRGPRDWVYEASRKQVETRAGKRPNGFRVAVLDFGSKENILRELESRFQEIQIFPSRASAQEILKYKPHGLMLTNGPGDPAEVQESTNTVRELVGKLPIFGICMGHQILGLALGAKTYKMKFGHRGSNHPIRDEILGKVYMTAQNHGYAVDSETLPKDMKVTHRNLNDQTVAGFYSAQRKCLGIQYHPESHPGPHEAAALFDFFVEMTGARP